MRAFNEIVRFVLELLAFAVFGLFGYAVGEGVWRYLLMVGLPLAAAVLWGQYAAPRSVRRLPDPQRFGFELGFFGAAVAALVYLDVLVPAIVFGVLALANMVLVRLLKGRSLEPSSD